jgi:hypothetical protein
MKQITFKHIEAVKNLTNLTNLSVKSIIKLKYFLKTDNIYRSLKFLKINHLNSSLKCINNFKQL